MQLTMLGTGNALVTECYNTCFVLSEGQEHFLVDTGGGNRIILNPLYCGDKRIILGDYFKFLSN